MTTETNESANLVADPVPASEAIIETSAPVEPPPGMVPQEEVNRAIGAIKAKAHQKGFEAGQQAVQAAAAAEAKSMGGMPADIDKLLEDKLQKLQAQQLEQYQQQQAQAEANRVANEIAQKSSGARQKFQDFDDKLKTVGYFEKVPQLLHYVNNVDNAGEVLYDLANNPSKITNIAMLGEMNPDLAVQEVKKLSDSIKTNESAQNMQHAPSPLESVKSSNVDLDTGAKTIADFKKAFRG